MMSDEFAKRGFLSDCKFVIYRLSFIIYHYLKFFKHEKVFLSFRHPYINECRLS